MITSFNDRIELAGGFTVIATIESDDEQSAPWECEDGPVSDWTRRDKEPGEMVLISDRDSKRYYDFAGAVKIARRDGWGCKNSEGLTAGQIAARAARDDYDRLHRWYNDDWCYVGVVVTVSKEDIELGSASLWGIEGDANEYLLEVANKLLSDTLDDARSTLGRLTA